MTKKSNAETENVSTPAVPIDVLGALGHRAPDVEAISAPSGDLGALGHRAPDVEAISAPSGDLGALTIGP